jgi:metallo-beta-lactamase family protein
MIRLQFLGAAGTVTGSKYLVQGAGASLLVDCGLFQGYKQLRLRNWAPLPVAPPTLHAVLLTHAHIDHSGYLPLLVRNGFRGRVRCTESTYELCRILLPDSAYLQEEQAEHANRHGWSKHHPALPLYTREDAKRALKQFSPVAFDEPFEAHAGIIARFRPAGHILGASSLTLELARRTLAFSGDLGRPDDPVMYPPKPIERADLLVLESTYGDRLHDPSDGLDELGGEISRTAARGGTIVVPTFAVGRAQALLLYLHRLKASGAIPATLPIYLDSPMARNATDIYLKAKGEHRLTDADCRAIAKVARIVNKPEESKALDQSEWPKVILSASGMASGGRVLHHIRRFAPDPRSLIFFTGFQAGGTRGDAMLKGAREVKIHGAYVPVRAKVRNFDSLSAHADRVEIVQWLRHFERAPGQVFLTHGEPAACDALRKHIAEALGWEAQVPDHLSTVNLPGRPAGT